MQEAGESVGQNTVIGGTDAGPPNVAVYGGMGVVEVLNAYRRGVEAIPPATLEMPDDQLDRMFDGASGEGLWSVRQLLGHVMDAELMNTLRMRKMFAEEGAMLPAWDEHAFLDSGIYGPSKGEPGRSGQPPAAFVAMIHTTRQVTANWLGRLEESDWNRRGLHPRKGEQTILGVLGLVTWHLEHHAWFLRKKLQLMGVPCGPVPGEACGPGCGCHGGDS